jgi:hypothetical protein
MRAFDETTGGEPRANEVADEVDEASRDSFPASDPPGWTGLRLGAPPSTPPPPVTQEETIARN